MYILADTIESSIGTYKQGLKYHPIQLDRKKEGKCTLSFLSSPNAKPMACS